MNELTTFLPGILLFYGLYTIALASPGPNIMAVIGTSMAYGRRAGIALALGIALGSLTWSTLTILGLTSLFSIYGSVVYVVRLAGGMYLLWMAYKAFKAAARPNNLTTTILQQQDQSSLRYLGRGYLIMMSNPKAIFAWISLGALATRPGAPVWVGLAIITGTFAISILGHCLYAVAFSTPLMVGIYTKMKRYIELTLGSLFALAGIRACSH